MKRFYVSGTFEADNIDHAFAVLGAHFAMLSAYGLEKDTDLGLCDILIRPVGSPQSEGAREPEPR